MLFASTLDADSEGQGLLPAVQEIPRGVSSLDDSVGSGGVFFVSDSRSMAIENLP